MLDLRLDHLGKTLPPSRHVLEEITFSVSAGECLALLGPSGCGKTTLLRIIAGLEQPTCGDVYLGGHIATHVPSHRRNVAMLFQRPALVPSQSVRQSLRWAWMLREPWTVWRRAREPREVELERIAWLLELDRDLERPVQELSGGQQQRVALGRCLLRKAPICLLDEPLGHLDAPLRVELRRQIRALARQEAMTLIHVTHDPEEALSVGDRVAVMHQGRIVQIDEPAKLQHMPQNRYVAELVCHQQGGLNFLPGFLSWEAQQAFFDCDFGRWRIPNHLASEALMCDKYEVPYPNQDKLRIIMGIAAKDVRCSGEQAGSADEIRLTAPLLQQENSSAGIWLLAGDSRGRWIGRSESFWRGDEVTMTFSLQRAFWFDGATGETLCAPAG